MYQTVCSQTNILGESAAKKRHMVSNSNIRHSFSDYNDYTRTFGTKRESVPSITVFREYMIPSSAKGFAAAIDASEEHLHYDLPCFWQNLVHRNFSDFCNVSDAFTNSFCIECLEFFWQLKFRRQTLGCLNEAFSRELHSGSNATRSQTVTIRKMR